MKTVGGGSEIFVGLRKRFSTAMEYSHSELCLYYSLSLIVNVMLWYQQESKSSNVPSFPK